MINIYAVNVKHEIDELLFVHLMSFLPEDKQKRIKKFHRFEDAQRTLIADIFVRTVICRNLNIKNKDIAFDRNEYGKPFLNHFHDFHFNISHAGEWIVCATYHLPVGIDVEYVQSIEFDIAKRFFSKDEYMDLLSIDDSHRLLYFYDLWTLKESYIKAAGKGLSIPLDSFSFKIHDNTIIFKTNNEFKDCYFKRYHIDNNYKMAVCSLIDDFSKDVIIKELDEIYAETLLIR